MSNAAATTSEKLVEVVYRVQGEIGVSRSRIHVPNIQRSTVEAKLNELLTSRGHKKVASLTGIVEVA